MAAITRLEQRFTDVTARSVDQRLLAKVFAGFQNLLQEVAEPEQASNLQVQCALMQEYLYLLKHNSMAGGGLKLRIAWKADPHGQ